MDVFKVIQPGPFTTVQDTGRFGYQCYGVPIAGALDDFAHRAANLLVGNPESAATLEMTFIGVKLEVLAQAVVAVCGAEMDVTLNTRPCPRWTAFVVNPGDVLACGAAKAGVRAYLAVSGGVDVPPVMGSRATYVGGKLGGLSGRPLVKGDLLPGLPLQNSTEGRTLPPEFHPPLDREITLRALLGPQDDYFEAGIEVFFGSEYRVGDKTDRMGCRTEGPSVGLKQGSPASIISEPSVPGGVQIPADGQPIILLVEQTVGGYAKLATLASADLGRVAQARPGDKIRFEQVTIDQARALSVDRRTRLERARELLGA